MNIYIHTCIHIYIYIYMCVYIELYVYICMNMCTYTYIYIYLFAIFLLYSWYIFARLLLLSLLGLQPQEVLDEFCHDGIKS